MRKLVALFLIIVAVISSLVALNVRERRTVTSPVIGLDKEGNMFYIAKQVEMSAFRLHTMGVDEDGGGGVSTGSNAPSELPFYNENDGVVALKIKLNYYIERSIEYPVYFVYCIEASNDPPDGKLWKTFEGKYVNRKDVVIKAIEALSGNEIEVPFALGLRYERVRYDPKTRNYNMSSDVFPHNARVKGTYFSHFLPLLPQYVGTVSNPEAENLDLKTLCERAGIDTSKPVYVRFFAAIIAANYSSSEIEEGDPALLGRPASSCVMKLEFGEESVHVSSAFAAISQPWDIPDFPFDEPLDSVIPVELGWSAAKIFAAIAVFCIILAAVLFRGEE
ncbi:MAG: hypothetical protein DRO05_07715 [Thermoproteota archaeon]|nr:MAG: hypothetical protein DRO05_07715 [Candidatus Korarchaeota archaeon]